MTDWKTSVLIPSYRRPEKLLACLRSLALQTMLPSEVLVVWQGDDVALRDLTEQQRATLPYPLRLLHNPEVGIVPSENLALAAATGDLILLIDDDAVAPPDWIARHAAHYDDSTIGAVGGPADNFNPDGTPYPKRAVEPVGRLTWYGKPIGNMYDQAPDWRSRAPVPVNHLVGYNMSLRRSAFDRFEDGLKCYWQLFELEACLQVRKRGYRVLFDFANVVAHYPTSTAYNGGRDGDLQVKVYNPAYNHAFILAKHSPPGLRLCRLLYLLLVGSTATPGLLGYARAVQRYGGWARELGILGTTWRFFWAGWRAGRHQLRRKTMDTP